MSTGVRRLDLRLLPAVLASWAGCWWTVAAAPSAAAVAVAACLVVATLSAVALRRRDRVRHRARPSERVAATVLLTAVVSAAVIGHAAARSAVREDAVGPHLESRVDAVLTLSGEPRQLDGQAGRHWAGGRLVRVAGDGGWVPVGVPVLVLVPDDWSGVRVGDQVRAAGRLTATARGDPFAGVLVAEPGPRLVAPAPGWQRAVGALRAGLVTASSGLSPQARGLVPGITLGDTRALPVDLEDDLRTVGLTHVTAVSGAHVAIILGGVLLSLWWAPRGVRVGVGAVVLICFVALVHPSGSVLRAAAMGAVMLAGMAVARPRATVPALWTAVVALLGTDPWLARSYGFVLSVLATAGLLLWAGPVAGALAPFVPRVLALAVAVPTAAQLACAPVVLLLQPGLSGHAVLANLLAAPAVPPATVLGVLATLAGVGWPGAAAVLAGWAGACTAWIAGVATWSARLPGAELSWPGGTGGAVALACVVAALVTVVRRRGAR